MDFNFYSGKEENRTFKFYKELIGMTFFVVVVKTILFKSAENTVNFIAH